jgi:hypothetical protein
MVATTTWYYCTSMRVKAEQGPIGDTRPQPTDEALS